MFQNPFSFEGRIRRSEFGISLIIYGVVSIIIFALVKSVGKDGGILNILLLPCLWFLWAQGAKRCHDLGRNGLWQFVPLFIFYLIFEDGAVGKNEYGSNAKGMILTTEINVELDQTEVVVYSEPNLSSSEITTLKNKDKFILFPDNDISDTKWDKIKLSNNIIGYIQSNTHVNYSVFRN